ncbi:unnamed protein product [Urochloa humidicola]
MAAPSKTWNIHNYILAALGGTLAATAVVIIISAIFSPAQISFIVTQASRSDLSGGDGVCLNLTISANTSQHRTKVKYESIFIDLLNSTRPTGRDRIHANVDNSTGWEENYVNFTSPTTFKASALVIANSATFEGFAGSQAENSGLTVVVTALVHFKVGVARTRLFNIKVFCYRVRFADHLENSISCGS